MANTTARAVDSLGVRCKHSQRGPGEAPGAKAQSASTRWTLLGSQGGFPWSHLILLLWRYGISALSSLERAIGFVTAALCSYACVFCHEKY